jgi:hypothetical protein
MLLADFLMATFVSIYDWASGRDRMSVRKPPGWLQLE